MEFVRVKVIPRRITQRQRLLYHKCPLYDCWCLLRLPARRGHRMRDLLATLVPLSSGMVWKHKRLKWQRTQSPLARHMFSAQMIEDVSTLSIFDNF